MPRSRGPQFPDIPEPRVPETRAQAQAPVREGFDFRCAECAVEFEVTARQLAYGVRVRCPDGHPNRAHVADPMMRRVIRALVDMEERAKDWRAFDRKMRRRERGY